MNITSLAYLSPNIPSEEYRTSVKSWEARKFLHLFILHLACLRWYCSIHSYFEMALFSFYLNSSSVISVLQFVWFQLVARATFLILSHSSIFLCLIFILFQTISIHNNTFKYFSFSLTKTNLKQISIIFFLQVEHYLFSACRLDIS